MDFVVGAGEDANTDVFMEFDEGTAKAEGNDAAERRVDFSADDEFQAGFCHFFDDDSFDFGVGVVGFYGGDDGIVCGFCFFIGFDADDYASRVTFVNDLGANDLHDNRVSDFCGRGCCGFGTGDDLEDRGRYVESPQKVIPVCFGEHFGVGMC